MFTPLSRGALALSMFPVVCHTSSTEWNTNNNKTSLASIGVVLVFSTRTRMNLYNAGKDEYDIDNSGHFLGAVSH